MNFKLGKWHLILGLCFSFGLAFTVQAEQSIGRVVKIVGEALKQNSPDAGKTIKNGDDIFVGDQIVTGTGSFIKILLTDDTLFQLGPKSEFKFEDYGTKNNISRSAIFYLAKGKLRSLFSVSDKDKKVILKTPTTAMGIRGTEILSDVYTHQGEIKTDVALLNGKLEVSVAQVNAPAKIIDMLPGQILETAGTKTAGDLIENIRLNIKELPPQIMNQLRLPENQGGKIFLFDTYRKELKNSEVEFSNLATMKGKIKESKFEEKEEVHIDTHQIDRKMMRKPKMPPPPGMPPKPPMGVAPIDMKLPTPYPLPSGDGTLVSPTPSSGGKR